MNSTKVVRKGYWDQLEGYIQSHSEAKFSHGVCPECAGKLYGDFYAKMKKQQEATSAKPPLSDSPKEENPNSSNSNTSSNDSMQ